MKFSGLCPCHLALCQFSDEFQTHRLHADSFDVRSRGWFRDHLHRSVSACGAAKTDPHEIDALRVRQGSRSEEHTSELQSHSDLVCRLLLEKKKKKHKQVHM